LPSLSNSRCDDPGCQRQPTYGNKGDKRPRFCSTHKHPGMYDVIARRCEEETCMTRAAFNFHGQKVVRFCAAHKLEGMQNLKSKCCEVEDCKKYRVYGFDGKPALCCASHKRDGMVDVRSSRCESEKCYRHPSFGYKWEKKRRFCGRHKLAGMADVRSRNQPQKSTPTAGEAAASAAAQAAAAAAAGGGAGNTTKPSPVPPLDTRVQRLSATAASLVGGMSGRSSTIESKPVPLSPRSSMTSVGGGFLGIGDDFNPSPVSRPLGARDLLGGGSSGLREDDGGRGLHNMRPSSGRGGAFGVGGVTYPPDPDYSTGALHPSVLSPVTDMKGGEYGGGGGGGGMSGNG
ncbi:unnamed protein product, partial [Laminaria digitata]